MKAISHYMIKNNFDLMALKYDPGRCNFFQCMLENDHRGKK